MISIEKIFELESISIRTYNICIYNNLKDLISILSFYKRNDFSFEKLRNCGRKTNLELTNLCNKYYNKFEKELLEFKPEFEDEDLKKDILLQKIICKLDEKQIEIINYKVSVYFETLSRRTKNSLIFYLNRNFNFENINNKLIKINNLNNIEIKNAGTKTLLEINTFILTVKEIVSNIAIIENNNDLNILKNRYLFKNQYLIDDLPNEIIESESFFKIIDFLINNNNIFDDKELIIFKKIFKIYFETDLKTIKEVSKEINLSTERVRQTKSDILNKLYKKFISYISFKERFKIGNEIELYNDFIYVTNEKCNQINSVNKTNFSKEFISYLIYIYSAGKYKLIGNTEDVLLKKNFIKSDRHNWNNFYLVDSNLVKNFKIDDFINEISNRNNEQIDETYKFNFKSYLTFFINNNNFDNIDKISNVFEKIINIEFGIILDLDDNIVFNRSKKISLYEYAYEALIILDKPSFVSEIKDKICDLYPNLEIDEAKVSSALKRKDGFVPIERKSLFGLKIWEKEKENFIGGTIKDVVYDFLKDKTRPQHILKIKEYIQKMREKKDQRSIITNLKLDPLNRFIFFNQNFIGIKENNNIYTNNFKNIPIQLGKNIISKFKNGYTISDINLFLQDEYELNYEESDDVINNLKYFNEN
jgi:hypothetical protein